MHYFNETITYCDIYWQYDINNYNPSWKYFRSRALGRNVSRDWICPNWTWGISEWYSASDIPQFPKTSRLAIKINVTMRERFAFATEEEINLLVDKAVPENTKKSTSYTVNVFHGKLYVIVSSNLHLHTCSNTQACCEILAWFKPSFYQGVYNSAWTKNMKKRNIWKTKRFSPSHYRVFIMFFQKSHQQAIKRVYKRRARKYFAQILRRGSLTRRQIIQS